MSKPPIKRGPGKAGPRKPVRSDARGASSRPSRPRGEDDGEAPRKRFAKPERFDKPEGGPGDDAPWRKPRAESSFGKKAEGSFGKTAEGGFAKKAPGAFGKGRVSKDGGRPARAGKDFGKDGGFAPRARKPSDRLRDEAPRRAPAPQTAPDPDMPKREGDRIAKVMARAGLCSRRDAEIWIAEGRVAVNGRTLDTANVVVGEGDKITVDGHPLAKRERTRLFLFNKPRGLVTTDRDPEGRPTIFEAMPQDLPRLVTIGRLDINTEGLLLLTNDGGLARVLELPSTGWLRRYRVRAHGDTDQSKLDALRLGVTIDGVDYAGVEASLDRVQGGNVWLTMGLREGKNREVKRILEHLGLAVNRLIRVSYGPFQLGDLPEGAVEEVRSRHLREQLGAHLAAEAGVDFDSPLVERDEKEERVEPRRRINWRQDEPDAEAPRRKPAPAKRAHVSALRADRAAETERKRSERSQTEDRHGRVVAVERRVRAEPEPEAPKKRKGPARIAGERRAEGGRDMPRGPRDAGRPATGRARGAGARSEDAPKFSRAPRQDGAPRLDRGEAPARSRRFNEDGGAQRAERPYGATSRGPRPEGGARYGKPDFSKPDFNTPRGEGYRGRSEGDERPRAPRAPRGEGYARPEGGRAYRARPEGERPQRFSRPEGGERPARAPRGEGRGGEGKSFGAKPFGGKPFGDKPFNKGPRREGGYKAEGERPARAPRGEGKSFGAKPFGGKPFGGKPGGRPSGGRPAGGKPFGGKPSGGKPGGRGPRRGPRREG